MFSFLKGIELENNIEYIYSSILSNEDINVLKLEKRCKIRGKSGCLREFDIYYEFKVAGYVHKVAIECKNYKRPISINIVDGLIGKLNDFNNIKGIIISKNGYQKGAKEYAMYEGIEVVEYDNLPKFNKILADKLAKVCLPTVNTIGKPFYVIMEKHDELMTTGNHFTRNNIIPLFICRKAAERYLERMPDKKIWAVYGVSKEQLIFICSVHKLNSEIKIAIVTTLVLDEEKDVLSFEYSPEIIKESFV